MSDENAPEPADLAREALRRARSAARARSGKGRPPATPPASVPAPTPGGDPVPVSAALHQLLAERGWQAALAASGVLARWGDIVGPDVAAHCRPVSLQGDTLVLAAESTAWATQIRLLEPVVLAKVAETARGGDASSPGLTVRRLVVRGPGGAPPRPGRLRSPDSRGPGDTYG